MHKNASDIKVTNPIVLFDGVCNFCNTSVRFVLAYNKNENIHFSPLQSDFAKQLLAEHHLSAEDMDTVVFVENNMAYTRSSAAFQIAKHLSNPWKAIHYFRFIPKNITDWIYNLIARNRYSWFGKKDRCMVPKPEWMERFHE
ncbi:thiol-disulfide oxidoreductase DCC family protein [Marinifilum caeruleilacunae]|uniref:Thiol-disulfide oxidoreductase DCC family protein n=1 Tax=Marinifilum caeruleilacunae TaxID=2499076 RepID=A0ABX1WU61_9BACT|nr:thiol-disulfide oxidoreductase DCC family protein [Marinifilum caeruleilacunae]NOU59506.1 thiol-disulfide oxidoreductase DCC family protein [Marinifilum caeruleilacunae]